MGIVDTLVPYNDKRRERCDQLAGDVRNFGEKLQAALKTREQQATDIQPRLNELMQKLGFASPDALRQNLEGKLNQDDLQKYKAARDSLNGSGATGKVFSSIVDLLAGASGVVGFAEVSGIALAAGAFSEGAVALVVVLGVSTIVDLIDASQQRDQLRDYIQAMVPKRQQVRQAEGRAEAINSWLSDLESSIRNLDQVSPAFVNSVFANGLGADFNKWTDAYTKSELDSLDKNRPGGAWTEEDPPGFTNPRPPEFRAKIDEWEFEEHAGTRGNSKN